MSWTVYPAIDVRGGRVVRLRQGDYAQETRYASAPLELAQQYSDAGARWLHLVDLDAARHGGYTLHELVGQIIDHTGLQLQTGGGVRKAEDVQRLLDAGASRVVVGSIAVQRPDEALAWLQRFGAERLTLALDARRDSHGAWTLPVHGWTEGSGVGLQEVLARYRRSELRHVLCTDIGRDGMLAGPNLDLYAQLQSWAPELQVQASGGVRDSNDVRAAREQGLAGIVLGRALLEDRLSIEGALAC